MKKVILLLTLCTLYTLFTHHTLSQWYQQTIPVSKPITGIKFIDSLKGWACTSIGTSGANEAYILHTSNGGTNWIVQYIAVNSTLASISVIDTSIIYVGGYDVVGNVNELFKTTNGGINWVNKNPPSVPADMFFVNKDSGWYCDDFVGPDVRTTSDGGNTWSLRINSITQSTKRLFFLNYTTGWVAADFRLYKTTDAGLSWNLKGDFIEGIRAIYFLNENTGWLGMTNNKIRFTSNGGVNWSIQVPTTGSAIIPEIYFYDLSVGFAGSAYLEIYKTINGGINWGYQIDSSGSYRFSFIDTLLGWTGDTPGRNIVSHTTNGGGPITYVGIINSNHNTPESYELYQNYPNPFNLQTTIRFSVKKPSYVKLKIYDVLGREKTIWESTGLLSPGTHKLNFNAENYASGVYFYQITVLDEQLSVVYRQTRKMILIK